MLNIYTFKSLVRSVKTADLFLFNIANLRVFSKYTLVFLYQ